MLYTHNIDTHFVMIDLFRTFINKLKTQLQINTIFKVTRVASKINKEVKGYAAYIPEDLRVQFFT